MDTDLSQFYQMFFEECLESLESVEKTLLSIDILHYTDDEINLIFRCMHSLKGGSATFGFTDISEFTHTIETYLDDVRNKKEALTSHTLDLLLKVVDASRSMILKHQGDASQDLSSIDTLRAEFVAINNQAKTNEIPKEQAVVDNTKEYGLYIYFKPYPTMMQKGNDPLRMFSELKKMGHCTILAEADSLPEWSAIDPEQSFLIWHIYIKTTKSEAIIKSEIFDWVIDECDLKIDHLADELGDSKSLLFYVDSRKGGDRRKNSSSSPVAVNTEHEVKDENSSAQTEANVTSEAIDFPNEESGNKAIALNPKNTVTKENASIRVATDKVDSIINLVGELVITQAILQQLIDKSGILVKESGLKECLSQFSQNIRELQESVMIIRMLPISNVFNRFPRMVRDMAQNIGKKVELKLTGEDTELDKTVLEKIGDPLVHLVRNSLDHGIETSEVRLERGKSDTGILHLNAYHQGSNIIIDVIDDGNGLNTEKIREKAIEKKLISPDQILMEEDIHALIFLPGFSTAQTITDISGRGVGMDVVQKNIQMVGGRIKVNSKIGEGSVFSICLPLTLSIIDGQILKVAEQTFIFPINSILEIIQISEQQVSRVGEFNEMYFLRNKYIPIIHLTDVFNINSDIEILEGRFLIIIEVNQVHYGIVIDDLLAQQQIVIKNIEHNYKHIEGIAGATVLGDGTVALIIDIAGLVHIAVEKKRVQNQTLSVNNGITL